MKTTKSKNKKLPPAAAAFDEIAGPKIDIDEINRSLMNRSGSESVEYMFKLISTKDWQKIVNVLGIIQDAPQQICGDSEFDTVVTAAKIDGERQLLRKFVNLVNMAMEGNREGVERALNPLSMI